MDKRIRLAIIELPAGTCEMQTLDPVIIVLSDSTEHFQRI